MSDTPREPSDIATEDTSVVVYLHLQGNPPGFPASFTSSDFFDEWHGTGSPGTSQNSYSDGPKSIKWGIVCVQPESAWKLDPSCTPDGHTVTWGLLPFSGFSGAAGDEQGIPLPPTYGFLSDYLSTNSDSSVISLTVVSSNGINTLYCSYSGFDLTQHPPE
ncbi:MAG TPA: hypothetical protein VHU83_22315 [Bryobacteraceae bacterium]|jgi:hypothetical protein|nr:hypothetical protein [Bryobacteraceae bacterium]